MRDPRDRQLAELLVDTRIGGANVSRIHWGLVQRDGAWLI